MKCKEPFKAIFYATVFFSSITYGVVNAAEEPNKSIPINGVKNSEMIDISPQWVDLEKEMKRIKARKEKS